MCTDQKSINVLEPGRYSFPFALAIPLFADNLRDTSEEPSDLDTPLPPSVQLLSDSLKVTIAYRLKAVVHRPGMFIRNFTAAQDIDFRPLQPPDLSNCHEDLYYLKISNHLSGEDFCLPAQVQERDALPSYSPSIKFEVAFLSPNIIHPGDHVTLQIVVTIPKEIQHVTGTLWLTKFAVRIRATTTCSKDYYVRAHDSLLSICDVRGTIPMNTAPCGEIFRLPCGLWEHQTYPYILPSFASRGVRMTHRFEVEAQIMSELTRLTHVRTSSPRVMETNIDTQDDVDYIGREREEWVVGAGFHMNSADFLLLLAIGKQL